MQEQTSIIPTYNDIINNGKYHFLQQTEKQETIDEKTGEKTINFIENPNTGGYFYIYNKNDNSNPLGWLCLYNGKLYVIDYYDTQNITLLNTNTLEDLENLKNTYDIYYKDKEKPNKLQPVSIEDETDIQVDRDIVLSFDKIDLNNPSSELYLKGIYDGEFKKTTKEITNPETNEKTTETKNFLTGYANIFYQNKKPCCEGTLKNGVFKRGKCYRKDGTLLTEGDFILNEQGYIVLNGENCIEYYKDGKTKKNIGTFKNGVFEQGKYYREDGTLWLEGTFTKNKDGYIVSHGDDYKDYYPITIRQGQFKDNWLYSGSAYLRDNPTGKSIEEINNEQINSDNKIYTLEREKENPDKRIITFYGKVIGLEDDIKLQMTIDKDNIVRSDGFNYE